VAPLLKFCQYPVKTFPGRQGALKEEEGAVCIFDHKKKIDPVSLFSSGISLYF
jgi:hypothetical protein